MNRKRGRGYTLESGLKQYLYYPSKRSICDPDPDRRRKKKTEEKEEAK